jgi:hypothetical protein
MSAPEQSPRCLICVNNEGYAVSLELRKVYRALPDVAASRRGFVRVVDESGDDFLYPEDLFVPIELPRAAERAFALVS